MNFRDPKTPMGTVVLIVLFLLLTAGLWFNAYLVLLARGGNI